MSGTPPDTADPALPPFDPPRPEAFPELPIPPTPPPLGTNTPELPSPPPPETHAITSARDEHAKSFSEAAMRKRPSSFVPRPRSDVPRALCAPRPSAVPTARHCASEDTPAERRGSELVVLG